MHRQITATGIEPELAYYYLCCAPATIPDDARIQVAGSRWAIEECFQTAKTEAGLDHYQVRRYYAWYRHITVALLALGEVRRLLAHLTDTPLDRIRTRV